MDNNEIKYKRFTYRHQGIVEMNPSKLFPYFEYHQSIQKYSKNLGVRGD